MPFGRKSPLEALALPGIILAYKYSQFRQRRREAASRRITERELSALHNKIDKLLNRLDDAEPDPPTSQENECVICINARATMQTSPCGHCVVCRRCFVKTIQSAVAQRLLPLRCVICRARVNRLTSISGNWRMQDTANGYLWNGKNRLTASASEYKMPTSASTSSIKSARNGYAYTRSHSEARWYVSNSASLYSMSSTASRTSASSKTSSSSYALSSPCTTPLSEATNVRNSLAPPVIKHTRSLTLPAGTTALRSNLSPKQQPHSHCTSCPSNCSGAIPRKPLKSPDKSIISHGLPHSNTVTFSNPMTHTYPGRRLSRGRTSSLKSHLPPIEEFRSPAKVPHTSPVHINNPRFRYASYTKTNAVTSFDTAPFLCETSQASLTQPTPHFKASGAKVCPVTTRENLPKMAFINNAKHANKASKNSNGNKETTDKGNVSNHENNSSNNNNKKPLQSDLKPTASFFNISTLLVNYKLHFQHNTSSSSSTRKNLTFLFKSNHKEKTDNKNNEAYERKKREEKLKQKADRETRKEEKRKAKEEERLAKAVAKEDKKLAKSK